MLRNITQALKRSGLKAKTIRTRKTLAILKLYNLFFSKFSVLLGDFIKKLLTKNEIVLED